MSTVFEAPDAEAEAEIKDAAVKKQPPERPPPPKLFPEPIEDKLIDIPEVSMDEPEVDIPEKNPGLYKLVQMSQEMPSFDFGTEIDERRAAFGRQNSNSFWWDVDGEDPDPEDLEELADKPFVSSISITVYKGTHLRLSVLLVLGVFLSLIRCRIPYSMIFQEAIYRIFVYFSDGKPSDSSGEEDSDEEEHNGNEQVSPNSCLVLVVFLTLLSTLLLSWSSLKSITVKEPMSGGRMKMQIRVPAPRWPLSRVVMLEKSHCHPCLNWDLCPVTR